jgi:hypothetical protein
VRAGLWYDLEVEIAPEPYSYDDGASRPSSKLPVMIATVGAIVIVGAGIFGILRLLSDIRGAKTASRVSASRAMIQDLAVALKAYETDFGVYPPPGNACLVRALETHGPKDVPYYQFRDEEMNARHEWLDYWKHPFVYELPAGGKFRLYSWGPNGKDENGAGDDIVYR